MSDKIYAHVYDVIIKDAKLSNDTYGDEQILSGVFDAGVNFNLNNVKLELTTTDPIDNVATGKPFGYNDIADKLEFTVNVAEDGSFKYNITGQLNPETYYIGVVSEDYDLTETSHVNINKAKVSVDINNITITYGEQNSITINGYFITPTYGINYSQGNDAFIGFRINDVDYSRNIKVIGNDFSLTVNNISKYI